MAYITYDEYRAMFPSISIASDEFDTLSRYSEIAINNYVGKPFGSPTPADVKEATAMQITASYLNGGINYYTAKTDVQSENIGGYSYSYGSQNPRSSSSKLDVMVIDILSRYCWRGVTVK